MTEKEERKKAATLSVWNKGQCSNGYQWKAHEVIPDALEMCWLEFGNQIERAAVSRKVEELDNTIRHIVSEYQMKYDADDTSPEDVIDMGSRILSALLDEKVKTSE